MYAKETFPFGFTFQFIPLFILLDFLSLSLSKIYFMSLNCQPTKIRSLHFYKSKLKERNLPAEEFIHS
jgi:hypothetical protein